MRLNELEYLEMPGLNVMLAHDYYPEGHQGGVGIIQNGLRVATNGDIRLDRTPGQWQPVPKVGKRVVDRATGEISLRAEFPDEAKNRKGFNPVEYPDLRFAYTVRVRPEGKGFRILVDLEQPLPDEWVGRVGFNMELFPGILFGKSFATETQAGIFPRQPNGPGTLDAKGEYQIAPLATGKRLVIAPESESQRMAIEDVRGGGLELVDGRGQHNNGWFVVRSLVPKGATKGAVEWLVTPHAIPGFTAAPTVQVSQVGYHPKQQKWAIVETDPRDARRLPVVLSRVTETGALEKVMEALPQAWGRFLRYDYLRLDFTSVETPGMYVVSYGDARSNPFRIGKDVYQRHVWQPTVDSFLPVQMCHVRVNERYRVWHDACHLDDARMAPVSHNHFDGYLQGPSTLTKFAPGEPVPGLDRGGWHDAGDDDLRVESQADTMHGLALAWEAFRPAHDDTAIDQKLRVVEMHQPDGKPDVLQQIEHGALTVVGGYRALGRFYRGIISPTLRQYTHLGDFAAQTDNLVFDPKMASPEPPPIGTGVPGSADDRWVFTEQNPRRELGAAAGLAASARALRGYDDALAAECLGIAKAIWDTTDESSVPAPPWAKDRPSARIGLAVELLRHDRGPSLRRLPRRPAGGDRQEHQVHRLGGGPRAAARGRRRVHERGHGGGEGLSCRGAGAREEDAVRGALRARRLGRGVGDPGLRHGAVLPPHGVPGRLPEGRDAPRAELRPRRPPGPEQRVLRLGGRLEVGPRRLRPQPRRLGLHPGRQRLGHRPHPAGLPGAPRVAVPLAADGVRPRRGNDGLPVPRAGRRPPAQPELSGGLVVAAVTFASGLFATARMRDTLT